MVPDTTSSLGSEELRHQIQPAKDRFQPQFQRHGHQVLADIALTVDGGGVLT
jgi:hypothetical protein